MADFEVGLSRFARFFEPHVDRFRVIGGAAMWLLLDAAGLPARATKDLDIVLNIELMNREFGSAIWEFVRIGGYRVAQKSSGQNTYYRFIEPTRIGYPVMLEIFSRSPVGIDVASLTLPPRIKKDLETFLSRIRVELTPEILKSAGLPRMSPEAACDHIAKVFGL